MELEFSNLGNKSFDVYETIFNDLYKKTLKFLGISDNYITSVTIVDDEAIHAINKEYRDIDRATDVISFAFYDDPDEPKNKDDAPNVLGEIIISFEHALKQSVEYGHTLEREFSFLFIHGLLHLLGYNHETKEEEIIMFKLQHDILGGRFMDPKTLIAKAKEARELSYSPYSHFAVGAALLTKDDKVYLGANIENASYPLCMCAERNAIYNAYLHGVKKEDIVALALIADTDEPCSPCGACRQVISELIPAKAPIYMANLKGDMKETNAVELLPFAFSGDDL